MTESGGTWVQRAVEHIRLRSEGVTLDPRSQITVNFHPDRVVAGKSVIEWLAADGVYRSQFETGISNGGLTAHPGGDRRNWERCLFAGVYAQAPAEQRSTTL